MAGSTPDPPLKVFLCTFLFSGTGCSSVRVVHLTGEHFGIINEHPKMMGPQKYLGKSCYYRIECTAVTFLAAFMLRKPLNNVALATITHKKLERVSDGTNTQVKAQIINKCRIKMIQGEIYNVRDPP